MFHAAFAAAGAALRAIAGGDASRYESTPFRAGSAFSLIQ
jgi:hypothetical protein